MNLELTEKETEYLRTMIHIELQTYEGSHKDMYYNAIKNIHSKLK